MDMSSSLERVVGDAVGTTKEDTAKVIVSRRSLFRDVPMEKIDLAAHKSRIISPVLSFGIWDEIRALFGLYGEPTILQAVRSSRSIAESARDLWLAVLTEEDPDMLHMETLAESTKQLLLSHGGALVLLQFILCGGTAAALRLGHLSRWTWTSSPNRALMPPRCGNPCRPPSRPRGSWKGDRAPCMGQ